MKNKMKLMLLLVAVIFVGFLAATIIPMSMKYELMESRRLLESLRLKAETGADVLADVDGEKTAVTLANFSRVIQMINITDLHREFFMPKEKDGGIYIAVGEDISLHVYPTGNKDEVLVFFKHPEKNSCLRIVGYSSMTVLSQAVSREGFYEKNRKR